MKLWIKTWITLNLLLSYTLLQAAPSAKAVKVLQNLNHSAGLAAASAFHGGDGKAKDGPMVKLGLELGVLYQEYLAYQKQQSVDTSAKSQQFRSTLSLIRHMQEKVVIDVVAQDNVEVLLNTLKGLGAEKLSRYGRVISARLPISALKQLAEEASLKFARPAKAALRTGSVTSQGDIAMLSDSARSSYSVDGTGVTIGTLSDSYNCRGGATVDVASDDLPSGIQVLQEETGCFSGSDEGRAMMQIIHDVAPGANQAFHTAFDGEASFANGILALADQAGADIINDDVIYFTEPMFQDGIIAQAIDTVKAQGVAYFSAAGNSADDSYESSFVDSGLPGHFAGSVLHDFDNGTGVDGKMSVTIPGSTQITFVLQWDDPFFSVSGAPGADTDMDIILYSATGSAIIGGIDTNIGGDAVEYFTFNSPPGPSRNYQLGIEHFSGPLPGLVKFVYFGEMTINEYATNSSTSYGHPIASGGQAVGAASYDETPAFGVSPPLLEYFSSKGGIPILFDTAGNAINDVRLKPDIVAPDGGDNTFFGSDYEGNSLPNFFGTSAAAPHAAGMAALMKQFDNNLGPDEIYNTMQTTAIDMGTAGFDFDSGYGLIQATTALQSLDEDLDGIPNSQDNCPNISNPLQADNDNDAVGDACDSDDDNDGLSDSDELIYGSDPFVADSDGDNLLDGDEVNNHGTDPTLEDSDSDGFNDDIEVTAGSDPNSDSSIPGLASGDINGDSIINAVDVLLATRIALQELEPTTNQLLRGDVVINGVIDTADLLIIQNLLSAQ